MDRDRPRITAPVLVILDERDAYAAPGKYEGMDGLPRARRGADLESAGLW